ncbi:hypothetical protein D3C76_1686720 [compost metagenome]
MVRIIFYPSYMGHGGEWFGYFFKQRLPQLIHLFQINACGCRIHQCSPTIRVLTAKLALNGRQMLRDILRNRVNVFVKIGVNKFHIRIQSRCRT